MSKKVEENLKSEEFWTLPKYKNKFGTDEYHEHLKKFLAKNDFEKLFRALKYSDILLKKSEKIKKTKNIILENCSSESCMVHKKRIKKFLKEKRRLNLVYSEIKKRVEKIHKKEIITFNICNYVNKKLEEINDKIVKEGYTNENLDNKESFILILSNFLKERLKNEKILKYVEDPNFNMIRVNKNYNILKDLYNFNYLTDIWKYSDLKIENNYFKEIGEYGKKKIISQYLFLRKKEEKGKSVNYYEEFLLSQIKEYFYIESINQKYLDISLGYWIIAYLILRIEVKKNQNKVNQYKSKEEMLKILIKSLSKENIQEILNCIKKSEELFNSPIIVQIKELLSKLISREKAEIILDKFIFTKDSKDLYDSPIIEHEKGYIILPQIFLAIDFSRALFSIISNSNKGNIEQKGDNLENTIKKIIERVFSKFEHKKKGKFNGQKYELDFIYKYKDELIFLEIKTQKQPENYYDFYRSINDLNKYIDKFNRNIEYYKNIDDSEKIFLKQDYKNTKKIFVSNVTYDLISIEDVFIIDLDDFFKFFKEKDYNFSNLIEKKRQKILEIKSNISNRETIFSQEYNGIKGIINYCIKD